MALSNFPDKPSTTSWATYARCHDDIGWAVSDTDARGAAGPHPGPSWRPSSPPGYYPGSFARGLVFQHNPINSDRRISGTTGSLAGLEDARWSTATDNCRTRSPG